MMILRFAASAILCLAVACSSTPSASTDPGPVASTPPAPPLSSHSSRVVRKLKADQTWRLNTPGIKRFDASALFHTSDGRLLTLHDREADLFEIKAEPGKDSAEVVLLPGPFTKAALKPFASQKIGRYDAEGLAMDEQGRYYLSEESNRWILRANADGSNVEHLPIDWSPVKKWFHPTDLNSSFEGLAVGGGRLYVANERNEPRIIVVDLATMKVIEDFLVSPKTFTIGPVDYSDLTWFKGRLFILCRHHRVVLEVDPATHAVVAEYDFRKIEQSKANEYVNRYPTGTMEGLAVDDDYFWLATDNNGQERKAAPGDIRPTLFRCPRPR